MFNDKYFPFSFRPFKQQGMGNRSGDLGQVRPPPNIFGRNNLGFVNPLPNNVSAPLMQKPRLQVPEGVGMSRPRNEKRQQVQNLGISQNSMQTNFSNGPFFPPNILEKYTMKPASKDQYKRYIQKGENIFYEERVQAKIVRYIKWATRLLLVVVMLIVLSYTSVSMVSPYDGPAPKHGYVRNKVVYCDFGYRLIGNECVLDKIYNIQAEELALGVITDLKLQYGEEDCTHDTKGFLDRNIREDILHNEQLDDRGARLLQQQVHIFLSNSANKEEFKFDYDGSKVWPTQKMHSYTCSIKLFLESGIMWKGLLTAVGLIIVVWSAYYWYQQEQLAHKIYDYLKTRVYEKQTIKIDDEREAMEQIGHVSEKMWNRIDKIRTREKLIGYFEDESLFWKRI